MFDAFNLVGKAIFGDDWLDGKEMAARDDRAITDDERENRTAQSNLMVSEEHSSKESQTAAFVRLSKVRPRFFPTKEAETRANLRASTVWNWLTQRFYSGALPTTVLFENGNSCPPDTQMWAAADARVILHTGKARTASKTGFVLISQSHLEAMTEESVIQSGCHTLAESDVYTTPFLEYMNRASQDLGLNANTKVPKKAIEDWLRDNWSEDLGGISDRMIQAMATFLRQPKDQRGGHFKPDRDD